jgi:hypothetical protein
VLDRLVPNWKLEALPGGISPEQLLVAVQAPNLTKIASLVMQW